jgi:hypothetical protein
MPGYPSAGGSLFAAHTHTCRWLLSVDAISATPRNCSSELRWRDGKHGSHCAKLLILRPVRALANDSTIQLSHERIFVIKSLRCQFTLFRRAYSGNPGQYIRPGRKMLLEAVRPKM